MTGPRYGRGKPILAGEQLISCLDCGALISDSGVTAHDRFHSFTFGHDSPKQCGWTGCRSEATGHMVYDKVTVPLCDEHLRPELHRVDLGGTLVRTYEP